MPRKLLRRFMPNPKWIREHRLLGWLGPMLHHPRLWHVSRGGIALGTAIGLFFGLLSPVAQIPMAATFAVTLRANLPMAVAGTFITNPFTFAPVYYLAYRIGLLLTGSEPLAAITPVAPDFGTSGLTNWLMYWSERFLVHGKPLMIGLLVLATTSALVSYVSINWLWRAATLRAWRRRSTLRKSASDAAAAKQQ